MNNNIMKYLKREGITFDWQNHHKKLARRHNLTIELSEPGRLIMKGKANQ